MSKFEFQLDGVRAKARAGQFTTAHGVVKTPIFMPVGTQATVKALDSLDIEHLFAQIILANTYHLYLRPGMEVLKSAGGIHKFMHWQKPILTDSGGFQVFSLGKQTQSAGNQSLTVINDDGVVFKSHLDGSKHIFSPQKAIEIQREIGADIIMAFDECTPDNADAEYTLQALDRTHAWAKQCYQYWQEKQSKSVYGDYQALFGIIQGAMHKDLRIKSAQEITALDFDGVAVGGETIGYNMEGTVEVMDWLKDILPINKPRYAMGLGRDPQNLIDAVLSGFDMFDCVAPTRLARNGTLYFGQLKAEKGDNLTFDSPYHHGRLQIGNAIFTHDQEVIQPGCDCYTCQSGYSRSYLRHLFKVDELLFYRLGSIHNVRFMVRLSQEIRNWILGS